MRRPSKAPEEARMAAAANALVVASMSGIVRTGDRVVLVTERDELAWMVSPGSEMPGSWDATRLAARDVARRTGLAVTIGRSLSTPHGSDGDSLDRMLESEAHRRMIQARTRVPVSRAGARPGPVEMGEPDFGSPLATILALRAHGLCGHRDIRQAVEAVAARQRRTSAAGWARTCESIGLAFRGEWDRDPAKAEAAARLHSAADAATVLTSRRSGIEALVRALENQEFPDDPALLEAAVPYVEEALARSGRTFSFRMPEKAEKRGAMDPQWTIEHSAEANEPVISTPMAA